MYKILSLDGGGIRGLFTATLIKRLNNHPQICGWLDNIDLIAGTSTGGIIALALAMEKNTDKICRLYKCKGDNIFEKDIENFIDIKNILSSAYSNESLREELYQYFGEITLGELATKITIPTFDLDDKHDFDKNGSANERGWKPKIFHNFEAIDSDKSRKVADIALYTSSAPTYFPIADGFIDGGVFANNPSNIAIAQALSQKISLDDISLLSIGAGVNLQYIDAVNDDWGAYQWLPKLIDILMEGVTGIADFQAEQLLGERYNRVQIFLRKNSRIELDSIDKIPEIENLAYDLNISKTVEWIDKNWC